MYDIILADPPWSYRDRMQGHSFSLDHEYPTQSKQWIAQLPVYRIANPDCCLFLWATSPLLDEGIKVMADWGFTYKTVAFVWNKKTTKGKDAVNLGRWTMGNVELCLLGIRGRPNKWRQDNSVRQLVKAPRTTHSAKPVEVHYRIEQLLGDRPRIELFARVPRPGWHCAGNDIDGCDMKETLRRMIEGPRPRKRTRTGKPLRRIKGRKAVKKRRRCRVSGF